MATWLATLLQVCIDRKAHLAGKVIHGVTLRHKDLFFDTFLSNRLIELYSKCGNLANAHKVFDTMPNPDVYSWNAALGCCCKAAAGRLGEAEELFLRMPERNVVSWNTLIGALVRDGQEEKGLGVYEAMVVMEGLVPTHFTLASVLSACGGLGNVEKGRKCHGVVVKIGLEGNVYVGNALVCMYAKCGVMRDAVRVFGDLAEANEVTFTAMMGGLKQTDRVVEALEMFRLMRRKGVRVDSVSLSSMLGVCAKGFGESGVYDHSDEVPGNVNGQQIHGLTVKLGFEGDLHLNNSLLDMYAKSADMKSAEKVFAGIPEVSVVSWNVMITGYGLIFQSKKAMEYLRRMQCCGFEPDEVTYINLLAACVRSGDIECGREMFDSISFPNVISWNAILSGYFQNEGHMEVIKLFKEMQFRAVKPDRSTLAIALSSAAAMEIPEAGKEMHAVSHKFAFDTDMYVASALIGMYAKCGKTEIAKHIFHNMEELDVVCWNSMIACLSLNSQDKEAFTYFKEMRQHDMVPTQFSYATTLSCCAKLASSFQGKQVHAQITKDGYVSDVFVGSALIGMYCKCGDVDGARSFFGMMPGKSTVTWNEMIHGYAQNGRGDEAVLLYWDMIATAEKPDAITFIAVLTACSHSGLVDSGIEIFNSMEHKYGVAPILDHYTCIIDALGRAGRFQEAEVLLDEMPYKDDPIIWEVLLSSCRVHTNVSLAKRAADELIRLDPHNSAPYVLLANIYSSLGRWDEARAVRDLMSDKQVVKDRGYSWIEYEKMVGAVQTLC